MSQSLSAGQVEFSEQLSSKKEAYAKLKKVCKELRDLAVHKANCEELHNLEEQEKHTAKEGKISNKNTSL